MEYYSLHELMLGHLEITVIGYEREFVKNQLVMFLQKIPANTLRDVAENCVFIMDKGPASYIPKEVIDDRDIIWIYELLFTHKEKKQEHIVLHEVAHHALEHEAFPATDEDWEAQENEANALVEKWQNDFEKYRKGGD